MKTFEVYHIESTPDQNDSYYLESIEAKDIEEATKAAIEKWIPESYREDIQDESTDEHESYLIYHTSYYDKEGNEIEQPDEFDEDEHNYIDDVLHIYQKEV